MATILRANTGLVAIAWLGGVTGLSTAMVASRLPTDNSTWAASGFVTVRTTGGSSAVDYALRQPIVTIDCYACTPTSNKPPWGKAWHLAETIHAATEPTNDAARRAVYRDLVLPGNYPDARVVGATARSEPREAYGDPGGLAHVLLDVEFDWVELP
jgi:hypothetical protein